MKECFVTMITPYLKNGEIDYTALENYVKWYYENNLDGVFSICQSSEIFWLSLDERVKLNKFVYDTAKKLDKHFTVLSSGHVSDSTDDQIKELNAVAESGTDALILISNRLAKENEDDDVLISNLKTLMQSLPTDVPLGIYECPSPYKRLLTRKVLEFCASSGRFTYIKDTCCRAPMIAERVKWVEGSSIKLCNANCQTLLETLRSGAAGYCGIMANFHPYLYSWLCKHYDTEDAVTLQNLMGNYGFTECLCYPLTAKYHMNLCGNPTEIIARNRDSALLTEYEKSCMEQMKFATDRLEKELKTFGGFKK